ncbi:MAG TPA: PDZ domain-containing protein, partial [Blastocatellia bacterium]|nr:PDZ domain-containing protein [Blastocatellia bacterium]
LAVLLSIGVVCGLTIVAIAKRIVTWGAATSTLVTSTAAPADSTTPPLKGVQVLDVTPGGPASRAGLKSGDVITAYGEAAVEDELQYLKAALDPDRPASGPPSVNLSVWRAGRNLVVEVPTGRIKFQSKDWNKAKYAIYSALTFYKSDEAQSLFDRAKREGQLTDFQILMIQTMLIPEKASAAQDKIRQEDVAHLVALYPEDYLEDLARDFKDVNCFSASAIIYDQILASHPDDVSYLLNAGQVYARVDRNSDARRNVAKAMNLGISDYGYLVAWGVLGRASLGDLDFAAARDSFKKCFEYSPDELNMMMYLYSSAKTEDIDLFDQARAECREKSESDYYTLWDYEIDALSAYVLVRNGHRSEAISLAAKWKDNKEAAVNIPRYWRDVPGSPDVLENWQSLTAEAKSAANRQ